MGFYSRNSISNLHEKAKYPKIEVCCESYTNEAGSRGRENTCFLAVVGVEKIPTDKTPAHQAQKPISLDYCQLQQRD